MENYIPKWLVATLGVLLIVFVAMLVVQKGNELSDKFRNKKPTNTMSVSADGKVTASPDLATVNVGVMTQGTSAQDVKDKNNDKINKITAFIKQQGIDAKDITTSQFYFYPQQDYSGGTYRITGYQGSQTVTVKVKNVDKDKSKLEKILDGVVDNGANQIQGVSFSFEDPDSLKQQARKNAIDNAKQKAQELAKEAGITLGKVVSVSEAGGYVPGPIPYGLADKAMSSPMSAGGSAEVRSVAPDIQPGTQDITETMTVVFEVK